MTMVAIKIDGKLRAGVRRDTKCLFFPIDVSIFGLSVHGATTTLLAVFLTCKTSATCVRK